MTYVLQAFLGRELLRAVPVESKREGKQLAAEWREDEPDLRVKLNGVPIEEVRSDQPAGD